MFVGSLLIVSRCHRYTDIVNFQQYRNPRVQHGNTSSKESKRLCHRSGTSAAEELLNWQVSILTSNPVVLNLSYLLVTTLDSIPTVAIWSCRSTTPSRYALILRTVQRTGLSSTKRRHQHPWLLNENSNWDEGHWDWLSLAFFPFIVLYRSLFSSENKSVQIICHNNFSWGLTVSAVMIWWRRSPLSNTTAM